MSRPRMNLFQSSRCHILVATHLITIHFLNVLHTTITGEVPINLYIEIQLDSEIFAVIAFSTVLSIQKNIHLVQYYRF